jgi:DNA polymerase-3 subunit gamma/tau
MGQALYRKNRPKSLHDVVGQEHITHTLEHALKKDAISHAYLFTGPRGVGKTSVARILAHEINELPYTDDSMHLDIIEIDAASNRRIDEIRDLRDRVNIAPTSAKYKVYIIDEVHMLTREAFNALLKTLEEPPAHVVFILATTEAHKLPETIISRTQRFTFKPVTTEKVMGHLRTIAKQEKIDITDEALELIARHGDGSFRDSISLLDQAGGLGGKIDKAYIERLLGIPPLEVTDALVRSLDKHDPAQAIRLLEQLREQGYGSAHVARQLGGLWRERMLDSGRAAPEDFVLLQKLLDVPAAYNPDRYLELIVLEYALSAASATEENQPSKVTTKQVPSVSVSTEKLTADTQTTASERNAAEAANKHSIPPAKTKQPKPESANVGAALDEAAWQQVLAELKKKHNTLYGVARMAQPKFDDDTLELGFAFAFHRKRLSEAKNQSIITDIIKRLTGKSVTITCVEAESNPIELPEAAEVVQAVTVPGSLESEPNEPSPDIANISNIFGGGELLES